jgi:hypothetical protein
MQAMRASSFRKFRDLDRGRRELLIRVAVALSRASAAVAWLPFRRAIAFGSVELSSVHRDRPEECQWAIEAVARRLPWRTMCIEKGLALQRLLRRSGTDARLHYGARHDPVSGKLEAHVWVTVDGRAVIGGEEAAGFAEVASYP